MPVAFPSEIWCKIFIFSVRSDSRSLQSLMRVCHAFRCIANGTPQLWNHLSFTRRDQFTNLHRAQARLQKTGVLPLDVFISNIHCFDAEEMRPLAELLGEQLSRLQKLQLWLSTPEIAAKVLWWICQDKPASILKKLYITLFVQDEEPTNDSEFPSLVNFFDTSPRLTHISIPARLLLATAPLLPFSHVEHFTLDAGYFSPQDINDRVTALLSHMPSLHSLSLKGSHQDASYTSPPSPSPISIPHLLYAQVISNGYGLDIISRLDAPRLSEVTFNGYTDQLSTEDEALTRLMSTTLRHLSEKSPHISRLEFISTFTSKDYPWIFGIEGFPRLTTLRLKSTDITDDALRLCQPSPQLKGLELWGCEGVTRAGLLAFVQGCPSTFQLVLDSCPNITLEDATVLSDFVQVKYKHGFHWL